MTGTDGAMTPDREKLALEAAREAIARKKDADDAAGSAALIRAGKWDDVSEVANAIAGAREALALLSGVDPFRGLNISREPLPFWESRALLAETAPSGEAKAGAMKTAEQIVADYGDDQNGLLVGAIAAALSARDETIARLTRERDGLALGAQWARNRLDAIADESWRGDGRDLKRSIVGIFADFDEALTEPAKFSESKVSALEARLAVMGEALTPSGDTKAAYIGEFSWTREIPDPEWDGDDGEEPDRITERLVVPWTTIKEIMAAIRARAALEQEGRAG